MASMPDLHGLVSQWLLPFMMTNQMVSYFYIFISDRTFIIFFWWLDLWFSVEFSNFIVESKIISDGKFKSSYLEFYWKKIGVGIFCCNEQFSASGYFLVFYICSKTYGFFTDFTNVRLRFLFQFCSNCFFILRVIVFLPFTFIFLLWSISFPHF